LFCFEGWGWCSGPPSCKRSTVPLCYPPPMSPAVGHSILIVIPLIMESLNSLY
jgi:hypothetical protein